MQKLSRRRFLGVTALGTAGLALGRSGEAAPSAGLREAVKVKLGVASYSLRELSRADAIAALQALGTPYVSVKSMHLPYEATPEEMAAGRRAFEEAGLEIVSGGVIYLQENDDDHIRRHFEYARLAGLPMMVIAPTHETMPRIEAFVKEYDIAVAIHNHGPEDEHFPTPQSALTVIGEMDPRVGLCVDVGHTARAGVDVVASIAASGDRLFELHMKDLRDLTDKESQCIVGEGKMPVAALFKQLQAMDFPGYVNLEYEIDAENPLPGMQRSFAYMRGALAGLAE